MYGPNSILFRHYIEINESANIEMARDRFSKELETVSANLDLQHRVANHFVPLLAGGVYDNQGAVQLIFNSFQSNLFHLAGALQLMTRGYLGSTWPIFRVAYEGLLYAKLHTVIEEQSVFSRWLNGDPYLSTRRDVLKKIKAPSLGEVSLFWSMLCQPTHFSIYSGQPSLEQVYVTSGLADAFVVVFILLVMNEHILRRHLLSRSALYYVKRYMDIECLRRDSYELKRHTASIKGRFSKSGRRLAKEFTTAWVTK